MIRKDKKIEIEPIDFDEILLNKILFEEFAKRRYFFKIRLYNKNRKENTWRILMFIVPLDGTMVKMILSYLKYDHKHFSPLSEDGISILYMLISFYNQKRSVTTIHVKKQPKNYNDVVSFLDNYYIIAKKGAQHDKKNQANCNF